MPRELGPKPNPPHIPRHRTRPAGPLGRRAIMTTESLAGTVGIGPALALVDAVRDNDVQQVYLMHHVLGGEALAVSSAELIRRMLVGADTVDDLEGLEELHTIVHGKWTYSDIGIRSIERKMPYTRPLHYARAFGCDVLTFHMADCYVDEDGNDLERDPLQVRMPRGARHMERAFVLGVAYSTTFLAEELAHHEDVDLDKRIDAYRAYAATESLQLPG
jgi:hypothetical protein